MYTLSDYMIEWMTACDEYRIAYEKAKSSGVWDMDYYLHYEIKRVRDAEEDYLKALTKALSKVELEEDWEPGFDDTDFKQKF